MMGRGLSPLQRTILTVAADPDAAKKLTEKQDELKEKLQAAIDSGDDFIAALLGNSLGDQPTYITSSQHIIPPPLRSAVCPVVAG